MTEQLTADASATRAFFVDMLVRDISVDGAILDLIDNSVDAAYAHSAPDGNLDGLCVEVSLTPDGFAISDNCGGIDIDTAQHYAFRFGRAAEFNPSTRIGEFGIGMKRGVFRLGKNFKIDSSTAETRFVVDVDVEQWREQAGDWTFPMEIAEAPADVAGTTVKVQNLHESVRELFSQDSYPRRMLREVADRHGEAIKTGLEITLNNEPADLRLHELLSGTGIAPEHQREELLSDGQPVALRIVAGIGPDRRPVAESGWYVYCNGRLVLKADRTSLTGWGTGDLGGTETPAWHPQYARFRGFVFFTSEFPGALPWTTTKTEIDESSDVYRNALAKMRSVIRRFADYTNELSLERERFEEGHGKAPQRITIALETARLAVVGDVPIGHFKVPERDRSTAPTTPAGPRTTSIQFRAKASEVNELKKALGLTTNRQVGEEAFERLYDEEID